MRNRINELRKLLGEQKIDCLLVSSAINIAYLTNYPNFSKDEREAYLFITKNSAILFTDTRYIEAVEKIVPEEVIAVVNPPLAIINQMVKNQKLSRIGIEKNLTIGEYEKFKKALGTKVKIVTTDDLVEQLRSVKDDDEIKAIKKAASLTHSTFEFIKDKIKIGMTEKEVAWEMEKFIRQGGGVLAFDTIIAFGPHSSIPHHLTSDKRLTISDELILLDFGAKVDGYCADMTRILLTSSASEKAKKMYKFVLAAQKESEKYIDELIHKHKILNAGKIRDFASDILVKNNFSELPHGLGHGIGIEVHELPHLSKNSDDLLVEGNYFSIEPGIYIPGFGGVRIEDDYLITSSGLEQITKSPK